MLRFFVLLLLLANGLYYAWSEGWLRELGTGPAVQAEPQRLEQQIKPEALRILTSEEVSRIEALAAAPKAGPTECLEAGLFDGKQSAALRQTLEARLPVGSWTLLASVQPPRWIVYMGKFANADAANKKKLGLKGRSVAFEALRSATLEPGISLGGYDTQASANQALKELTQKGVRTAKVVQEMPERRGDMLRLPAVDEKLRPVINGLNEALGGRALKSCGK
jgi:hypothetical protein